MNCQPLLSLGFGQNGNVVAEVLLPVVELAESLPCDVKRDD